MDRMNKTEAYLSDLLGDFSYIRIPKMFINGQFAKLSLAAKFLYGLILDRLSLSVQNGWLDNENVPYAYYSIDSAAEDLGCKRDYVMKIFRELEENTLIIRKRQGNGKPSRVYITAFQKSLRPTSDAEQNTMRPTSEVEQMSIRPTLEPSNQSLWPTSDGEQNTMSPTSGGADVDENDPRSRCGRLCEVDETDCNKTNKNNTEYNNTLTEPGEIRRESQLNDVTSCSSENLPEEREENYEEDDELTQSVRNVVDSVLRSNGPFIRIAGSLKSLTNIKALFSNATTEHIRETARRLGLREYRPTDYYEAVVETLYYVMKSPSKTA